MKTPKEIFVNELIRSLNDDWVDWNFNEYVCSNSKIGIQLWIANTPILNLCVYRPTTLSFSLFDKFRVYRAMSDCKARKLTSLITKIAK